MSSNKERKTAVDSVRKELSTLLDGFIGRERCEEVSDGVFRISPCEYEGPEQPVFTVPTEVKITIGKSSRLNEIYFKYMGLLKAKEGSEGSLDWVLYDSERRALQKARLKLNAILTRIFEIGFTDEDLRNPENFEHPMFKTYLEYCDEHNKLSVELDVRANERLSTGNSKLDLMTRFITDVFIETTEIRDPAGNIVSRYKQEDIFNSYYWVAQGELMRDVFISILGYVIVEMSLALKKTQNVLEEAANLNEAIAIAFKDGTKKEDQKDTPSTKSSTSSETSIQPELGALKKLSGLKNVGVSSP